MHKTQWPLFALTLLLLVVIIANANIHTSLIGWDNLLTELHPSLNLNRSFFSVWQEYQGLGVLPGNSPAADFPRQILLIPLEILLPAANIRQIETFFLLATGTYSMYYFLFTLFFKYKDTFIRQASIFLGAIFYLCNLATVQAFYVPFEPFLFQFAFLPLLFALITSYLLSPSAKKLFFFSLIVFLAAPQAQVPTVFFVTFLAVMLVLALCNLLIRDKVFFQNSLKILSLLLLINTFWLLPFLYFFLTKSKVALEAKINTMATQTVFLQNKEFGTIHNTMLLQGFWFHNVDPALHSSPMYILQNWENHLQNPFIVILGFLLFTVVIMGFIYAICSKKPLLLSFAFLFIFSFTILTTASPPFSLLTALFQKIIPFWQEAFRFPFTKFSVLAGFSFAVFFAFGNFFLIGRYKKKILRGIHMLLVLLCIGIFISPLFQGFLLYPREKLQLPQEYSQLFSFFKTQDPNTRIANFPQFSFWGWGFTKWGYSGSGFLWYGLPQPILDRAFDVWSSESENYYWEVSRALAIHDAKAFQAVCNKYQIHWLILDKNSVDIQDQLVTASDTQHFFNSLSFIHKSQQFGSILVYRVLLDHQAQSFVSSVSQLPTINSYAWSDTDTAYASYGDYITSGIADIYYPFRSLFSNQNNSLHITEDFDTVSFTTSIPHSYTSRTLQLPTQNDTLPSFRLTQNHDAQASNTRPTITATIPKNSFSEPLLLSTSSFRVFSCDPLRNGTVNAYFVEDKLHIEAHNATACTHLTLPVRPNNQGFLLSMTTKHISSMPLHVWVTTNDQKQPILDTFVSSSMQSYQNVFPLHASANSKFYTIHIENISIGPEETINEISDISLVPIPYNVLTNIQILAKTVKRAVSYQTPLTIHHPNPTLYVFTTATTPHTTILLSQAYNPGWELFATSHTIPSWIAGIFPFWTGEPVGQHVVIDNWSNGWQMGNLNGLKLKSDDQFIIVFLPQYLEYLGFLLCGGTLAILIVKWLYG